jgi:dTDP-4-amino-4,6-dideoxygalactose transaminase
MVLFIITMLLVAAVVLGKYLIVSEIRRLEDVIRGKQQKLLDASGRVKVTQQRLMVAQKAEGLAAHKVATLKYRLTNLEEQLVQVELVEIKAELERQREVTFVLDKVIRKALGQAGVEDEDHIRKVMGVITSLIDLEKHENSDELIAAIREKLIQLKENPLAAQETPPPQAPSPGPEDQPPVPQEAAPLTLI